MVKSFSDEISLWIEERKKDIRDYADMPLIRSMNWDAIEPYLKDEIRKHSNIYFFFFIADKNGNYNTIFQRNAGNISDREYFLQVIISGQTVVSEPVISKSTKRLICVISSPIKDRFGNITGMFAATIDLEKIYSLLQVFKFNHKDSYSFIINREGFIISHPDKDKLAMKNIGSKEFGINKISVEKVLKNKKGYFTYNYNKINSYAYFIEIPQTNGWKIITKIPKSYLFEPIYSINNKLVIIGFIGLLTSVIIGFFLSASISNPIIRLTETFKKGLDENFFVRSDVIRNDEIGAASDYFNKLMDKHHDLLKELTESRNELLNARKLESIGILAGGIAHDFNNILTSIIGMISLAKLQIDDKEKVLEALSIAETSSLKAKNLTYQLLTFSKGGLPVKKVALVKKFIFEASKFVLMGSNVLCRYTIAEDLYNAEVDEGQISQVFNNILINAAQSMPGGGVIEIKAENVYLDIKNKYNLQKGKFIDISIKDSGSGISEDIINKIFDPYFTTKENGNGLGLATSYSIIKNHKGIITVDSKINIGSIFHIILPATRKKADFIIGDKFDSVNKNIKVMVIDDQESVLKTAGKILEEKRIKAALFDNGRDAIDEYKKALDAGEKYNAVVIDLTIPGSIGGNEIMAKLQKLDPHVKALVSSGYSNNPVMSDFKKFGYKGVISKPYTAEELLKAIDDITTAV